MSKRGKSIEEKGMRGGTSEKRKDGMRLEVPQPIRKDFLYPLDRYKWDVGREEEKVCCWLCCLKVEPSPRRFFEWERAAVVFEEFSFFLSLHHFALHFCQAITETIVIYLNFSVFAWQRCQAITKCINRYQEINRRGELPRRTNEDKDHS